jgi:hypothetical protein
VVRVTLRDFHIRIRHRRPLHAGRYVFRVSNRGPSSHNLTIRRRGFRTHHTRTMAAGAHGRIRIRLRRGRYTFLCSVPGHAALGMLTRVRVVR